MTTPQFKVGDTVIRDLYRTGNRTEYTITKVARKYAYVGEGWATYAFDMATGCERADSYTGNSASVFYTPEQLAAFDRRNAQMAFIRERGLDHRWTRKPLTDAEVQAVYEALGGQL